MNTPPSSPIPPENPQPRLRLALLALSAVALITTLLLVYSYLNLRADTEQNALSSAEAQARTAAAQIDAAFTEVMAIADHLADDLSAGAFPYDQIQERLQTEVTERPDIDGIAVTFEPFVYDSELRLYQHYVYRENGAFDVLDGATYDYTTPPGTDGAQTAWYHAPLENGAMWNEPFMATGAGKILIEYGVPFYRVGEDHTPENAAGLVTIDYSVQDMRVLMTALELGATGYGFVITPSGTFLAHPIGEYVVNQSIFGLADEMGIAELRASADRALSGEPVRISWIDPVTGEQSWTFFEPLPSTGWVMGIVLNRAELELDPRENSGWLVGIALSGAATIFFFALVIAYPRGFSTRELWTISVISSGLCVALIIFIWGITISQHTPEGVRITDRSTLSRFLENVAQSSGVAEPPTEIPTGILIQAMEFPDPTTVRLNGYIWQSYPIGEDAPDIDQGFVLSGRIGEEATIEEIQRTRIDDRELIVWLIGVSLTQSFDPSMFPFDDRDVDIRITPLDLDARVLFTPDLESYDLINPRLLPGLDSSVQVLNWSLQSSYFSYRQPDLGTTFGVPVRGASTPLPELFFSVNTQRGFVGPFIAYLLPAVVGLLMLFAYLLNERSIGDKEEITSALNFGAALFFVFAVLHTSLRDNIGATGLTYLEYLYVMLYIAIINVAANAFVVVRRPEWAMVSFRSNLIVKVLYFPVFTGALLIITLMVFMR
mgnify:FL=1